VGPSHVHDRASRHHAGLVRDGIESGRPPTSVQVFCFIATLAAGHVVRSVAMLYAFGSLVIFVLGGLTGVMVAVAPFNFQSHDTFFIVGTSITCLSVARCFPYSPAAITTIR
jgi:heme/copper-type cytochrome/quinol oxidase subunit 1